jgi:hypothetical protein
VATGDNPTLKITVKALLRAMLAFSHAVTYAD